MGPLDASVLDTNGRPSSGLITNLVANGQELLNESDAAAGWTWMVHSSVTGDNFAVVDGWVDDEFDTQRRRGRLPTLRTTFS